MKYVWYLRPAVIRGRKLIAEYYLMFRPLNKTTPFYRTNSKYILPSTNGFLWLVERTNGLHVQYKNHDTLKKCIRVIVLDPTTMKILQHKLNTELGGVYKL